MHRGESQRSQSAPSPGSPESSTALQNELLEHLPRTIPRLLGRYEGGDSGPLLLCMTAIHGNEPAGLVAFMRVMAALRAGSVAMRGRLIGLAGNLAALSQGRRFLQEDLNRIWMPERIQAVRGGQRATAEDHELAELLETLDRELTDLPRRAFFLDLHTTSAGIVPFGVLSDSLDNRAFAFHFPATMILGLEEGLQGTVADYINRLGMITLGFEGGQHDDMTSVDHHEAAIWVALHTTGCIRREPEVDAARRTLASVSRGQAPFMEIRHHHRVRPHDDFAMLPGFENFVDIRPGTILARDGGGNVTAPVGGRLLMPLYQAQGSDGFFIVQPVHPLWLRLSGALRHLQIQRALSYLPGVTPHPTRPHTLQVNPLVARWLVRQVFHLLGYRHRGRQDDGRLVFGHRAHDEPADWKRVS